MKIKELINILEKMNPAATVYITPCDLKNPCLELLPLNGIEEQQGSDLVILAK